jgi:alpha-tubulin suppressor-like RCC1 family protein
MTIKISEANIDTATLSAIAAPKVANIQYAGEDDTAASTAGGELITINGSGFAAGASILIGGTVVGVVTFMSSTQLTFISPANTAGSYVIYVINTDGGTAISIPGIQYSGVPAWSTAAGTLGNAGINTAINITLAAVGDAPVTYSVFSGTLPPGVTLNSATGFLSGTTPTVAGTTTYSFVIRATDLQNQDTNRSFSFTVTVYVGKLYAWGLNSYGQFGIPDKINISSPVQVGALANWLIPMPSHYYALAIKTDGTLWSWGQAAYGQLGNPDKISKSSPVQVGSDTTWTAVAASDEANVYAISNGKLYEWGKTPGKSSPTQVGILTNWSTVSAGGSSSTTPKGHATTTDGKLYAWGRNYFGQLGLNTRVAAGVTQVGTLTNWRTVNSTHDSNAFAIKTDGTLWAWGRSTVGQLGLSDNISRSSPVQVGALTTWLSVCSAGYATTIAIRTDGTMWAWGANYAYKALGTFKSSPIQVGSDTNWQTVWISNSNSTVATKTDGTLWAWGENTNGQLGFGDTIMRSSPVQVGSGTNWLTAVTSGLIGQPLTLAISG